MKRSLRTLIAVLSGLALALASASASAGPMGRFRPPERPSRVERFGPEVDRLEQLRVERYQDRMRSYFRDPLRPTVRQEESKEEKLWKLAGATARRMNATVNDNIRVASEIVQIAEIAKRVELLMKSYRTRLFVELLLAEVDNPTPVWNASRVLAELKHVEPAIRLGCRFTVPSWLEDCIQAVRARLIATQSPRAKSLAQILAESAIPYAEQEQRIEEFARATGQQMMRASARKGHYSIESTAGLDAELATSLDVLNDGGVDAALEYLSKLSPDALDRLLNVKAGPLTKQQKKLRLLFRTPRKK